jgi:hypothetical protein
MAAIRVVASDALAPLKERLAGTTGDGDDE